MRALAAIAASIVVAVAGVASAESIPPLETVLPLETVQIPPQPHASAVGTLFVNRCVGGCRVVKSGIEDARSRATSIPVGAATEYMVSEFAWGDTEWAGILQCMKEVYSPYNIKITDVQPDPGVPYNESIVAGRPIEIGRSGIGGIAPINGNCTPYNYTINFTFANNYGPTNRVFALCAVAAQESGHSFGLDHTYAFLDGSSGCRDPMTYRNDCGGQKFFRNETATCGESSARPCDCGANQNSHLKLLSGLGAGTPITRPPTVTVMAPVAGTQVSAGTEVLSMAGAQRGIKTVELWINGYLWNQIGGAKFGPMGQPDSLYGVRIPAEVPDGVLDLVIKAKDDIDVTTVAPTVTVTKGAPCVSADSCAAGQSCEEGRCFWAPATGDLGDACTYPQFCLSGICTGTAEQTLCTQACIPGVSDSCPAEFSCQESGTNKGVCWPATVEDGGICSTSNSSGTQLGLVGIALLFGLSKTRRRRR